MTTSSDELQVQKRSGTTSVGGRSYRILEVIGKGGFGTVYRAELLGSGGFTKQVALKVLHTASAPDEIVLRFRDEARILGLIQHRSIVKVDGLAQLDKGWAVVMEYVPGVNVSSLVKFGATPPRPALNIVEEVASALHAANALPSVNGEPLRLIHRDIKPANIRLSPQGEIKVLDFGVARAEFGGREALTEALRFGSARYMSPERADGIEGPFIDVYALGLILAELLGGQRYAEPPKNPERHAEWLAALLGAVKARLVTNPQLDADKVDPILRFTSRMLAFEVQVRPTARDVEREARQLASDAGGTWLREWAESAVPMVLARVVPQSDDPISGSILVEKAGAIAVHDVDTDTKNLVSEVPSPRRGSSRQAAGTSTRAVAGVGATVVLLVGLIVVAGVAVVLGSTGLGSRVPLFIRVPVFGQTPSAQGAVEPAPVAAPAVEPAPGPRPAEGPVAPPPPVADVPAPDVTAPAGHDVTGNANAEARRREEARHRAEEARAAEDAAARRRAEEDARRAEEAARLDHTAVVNGIEFDTLTHGVVVVQGDADAFVLIDSAGKIFEPGALVPGKYESRVTFNGQEVPGPLVPITVGSAVKVKCTAAMMVCSRQ